MLLDNMADITQMCARLDQLDAQFQAFMCDLADPFRAHSRVSNKKHLAGITVIAIFNDSDIDIDDIAFL